MTIRPADGMVLNTVHDNYRVEVEVTVGATYGTPVVNHSRRRQELDAVVAEIDRHVDNVFSVSAMWDTKLVCQHCGENVQLGYLDNGEPACCRDAQVEYIALGFKLS